jgi:hypothetical protein
VRQVGHLQELYRDARSTEHNCIQSTQFVFIGKLTSLFTINRYIHNSCLLINKSCVDWDAKQSDCKGKAGILAFAVSKNVSIADAAPEGLS